MLNKPAQAQTDKVYEDINNQQSLPPSMTFISSLLDLTKETWSTASSIPQILCKVENFYRTHGNDTKFLYKHSPPTSLIVDATQSRTRSCLSTPPPQKGRKLNVAACWVYSLAPFNLCAANYIAAMGAYHCHLWSKALPSLQSASDEYKMRGLEFHQEAITRSPRKDNGQTHH